MKSPLWLGSDSKRRKTCSRERTSTFSAQAGEAATVLEAAGLDQVQGIGRLMKYEALPAQPCPMGPSSTQGSLINQLQRLRKQWLHFEPRCS